MDHLGHGPIVERVRHIRRHLRERRTPNQETLLFVQPDPGIALPTKIFLPVKRAEPEEQV
jgi:hypothetical protein